MKNYRLRPKLFGNFNTLSDSSVGNLPNSFVRTEWNNIKESAMQSSILRQLTGLILRNYIF